MPVADPLALVDLAQTIRDVGLAAGLDRIGFTHAAPFTEARLALDQRKAQGLHATMQFTYRNPARATEPDRALPGVRSLVVAAKAYPRTVDDAVAGDRPLARVARYATGDHYGELRAGLEVVAGRLREDGWQTRILLDDNALVDRAAAHRAGLGWYGKNANILLPGAGSWFVLGSVLTDAPLAPVAAPAEPVPDGCHSCTRCLDGCPTGAIVEPGVVDARRCLAWLLQAEGQFPIELRVALGDRIYGCDECQEVCPPSNRAPRPSGASGDAPPSIAPDPAGGSWLDVLELLDLDDGELLARVGRWYIPRREARYVRRNALIVLGNAASVPPTPAVRATLARLLCDGDPLLRSHAVWAARRLGADELLDLVAGDEHADVVAELAAPVPQRAGSAAVGGTAPGVAVAPPTRRPPSRRPPSGRPS